VRSIFFRKGREKNRKEGKKGEELVRRISFVWIWRKLRGNERKIEHIKF
jgi:hypothetical protein